MIFTSDRTMNDKHVGKNVRRTDKHQTRASLFTPFRSPDVFIQKYIRGTMEPVKSPDTISTTDECRVTRAQISTNTRTSRGHLSQCEIPSTWHHDLNTSNTITIPRPTHFPNKSRPLQNSLLPLLDVRLPRLAPRISPRITFKGILVNTYCAGVTAQVGVVCVQETFVCLSQRPELERLDYHNNFHELH